MRVSSTTDPPNFRIEPTPYSPSSAAASGRGSCGALCIRLRAIANDTAGETGDACRTHRLGRSRHLRRSARLQSGTMRNGTPMLFEATRSATYEPRWGLRISLRLTRVGARSPASSRHSCMGTPSRRNGGWSGSMKVVELPAPCIFSLRDSVLHAGDA